MKYILFIMLFLAQSSFAFTSAFEGFEGEYEVISSEIVMTGDATYCNWMNLNNSNSIFIFKDSIGEYGIRVLSTMNNSPLEVSHPFKEFSESDYNGNRSSGVIFSDKDSASYKMRSFSSNFSETKGLL